MFRVCVRTSAVTTVTLTACNSLITAPHKTSARCWKEAHPSQLQTPAIDRRSADQIGARRLDRMRPSRPCAPTLRSRCALQPINHPAEDARSRRRARNGCSALCYMRVSGQFTLVEQWPRHQRTTDLASIRHGLLLVLRMEAEHGCCLLI